MKVINCYSGLKADIWSCGIIIYACLCGFLPFDHKEIQDLYKKIITGDYVSPPHLSREAKVLIKGLLTTNPEKRHFYLI
jgi:5'-AMP-activated protein kinase catalytic alpha subunit